MFWKPDINEESGPLKVLIQRGEFIDQSRDRHVPFKLYHPETQGIQYPVIVWSHGFGGNRDGAAFISRYIASFGYIIVHITHEGTDSSLWEGKPGHPWEILRQVDVPRATTLNRFKDVPFALDQLAMWKKLNSEIGSALNLDAMGISGHSFGALTTQVMAGQLVPDEQGRLISFFEKRFKAGILYSPVPIGNFAGADMPTDIYRNIMLPLFFMTGTEDQSPLGEFGYQDRLVVYNNVRHIEKHLLIKNEGDHMVYNGTRGQLKSNPLRPKHEDIIKVASLAFWDGYLKGDKKAYAWLSEGGFATYLNGFGEYRIEKP